MNRLGSALLLFIFLSSTSLMAQTSETAPKVSVVFAVLSNSVEAKSAAAGQELTLRTISDVTDNGAVLIPKGSKLLGHIEEVNVKGKGIEQTELYIIIDKAVIREGTVIPLQAIIAAVAPPPNNDLSSDPTYGMMHSNEQKMTGGGPSSASSAGGLPPASKASSTAAVATADVKGRMDEPSLLNETSQGAVGYEGLSLSWHLIVPPPVTVFATKSSNLKLKAGTQMLLRMATPRLPR